MNSMETAPTDGTRILLKHINHYYSTDSNQWYPIGEKWEEGWYDKKRQRWDLWWGSPNTTCAFPVFPMGWLPCPK